MVLHGHTTVKINPVGRQVGKSLFKAPVHMRTELWLSVLMHQHGKGTSAAELYRELRGLV